MKSGCAKRYAFQKFWGGGGGKGDLEKSRFDWVFLNDGVPNKKKEKHLNTRMAQSPQVSEPLTSDHVKTRLN